MTLDLYASYFDHALGLLSWIFGVFVLVIMGFLMVPKNPPLQRSQADPDVVYKPRDWEAVHSSESTVRMNAVALEAQSRLIEQEEGANAPATAP